jgi:hypothetical protein
MELISTNLGNILLGILTGVVIAVLASKFFVSAKFGKTGKQVLNKKKRQDKYQSLR